MQYSGGTVGTLDVPVLCCGRLHGYCHHQHPSLSPLDANELWHLPERNLKCISLGLVVHAVNANTMAAEAWGLLWVEVSQDYTVSSNLGFWIRVYQSKNKKHIDIARGVQETESPRTKPLLWQTRRQKMHTSWHINTVKFYKYFNITLFYFGMMADKPQN